MPVTAVKKSHGGFKRIEKGAVPHDFPPGLYLLSGMAGSWGMVGVATCMVPGLWHCL